MRIVRTLALSATLALHLGAAGAAPAVAADPALPVLVEPGQTQSPSVYAARRAALMQAMGDGVAVIYAEGQDDSAGHRQSPDFLYLTGVEEKGAVLVLAHKERTYREFLYLPSRDPEAERVSGMRDPIDTALRAKYGFEKIHRSGALLGGLIDMASRSPTLWQVTRPGAATEPKDLELYGKVQKRVPGVAVKSLLWTLASMRARHDDAELAIMQRSIRITEEGFRAAWQAVCPGASEGEVRAEAERVWRMRGSRRAAYDSIVGSGPNGAILHYARSERVMRDGELVLMDMGAEYAHYATDITRTVPVNGRFSAEQRKLYDIVLRAQQAALALARPGATYEDLDKAARKVIDEAGYGDYFIHGLGHFVGLDVHDAGAYHKALEAGMVVTIEPGIYIPEKALGIRIEDEVLITPNGARYLSNGLPRTADEIERAMAARASRK
ncbi:aminopeptidase P N-terminal domain-containing protein [Massilia sp. TWP1-3-3]|uniref:aminopeptidase P N-terminal domain-containing protein n=1 Tax=Massilia sp. TWP1-3-3 TaxID=2804573 RepID=UPI003CE8FC31